MITLDNLSQLLNQLGFTHTGQRFSKTIGEATLTVDLKKGEICYPEAQGLLINERQTCNLAANENFVVLECVHRLLDKGYKPSHIELEPKWQLGRGASGGRADILVKDNLGKPLLIIECKTAGSEFTRAWKKTQQDGDQLFSYAQQISETQFLCLYTSDLADGQLTYTSHLIAHRDNPQYLEDNPRLAGFSTATDVKERFAVWRDTYKLDYATKGLFEANIPPYQIGKDKYTLDDLNTVAASDQQKKYHEFATILRQHNVSGRENAFDKLVNLLLCKLVDETQNPTDLKFYWKGVAYDSHFDLFDRLQQLYKEGMGKFLGEPITYIDRAAVQNAMRFIKQNPDATQRAVWQLFLQQKFFTNNDFSFIDVHNERLFYQNAEVLLKIIQMWQDIRLTNQDGNSQFLGDLFEGFLDQGVKQSEGQYFTPLPICRFILMSLPLQSLLARQATPPKVIDYACGAGHFLTEYARQMRDFVPAEQLAEHHRAMIGIEKEYRLSKVAKVAAFMHGQRDIAICYGDALIKAHTSHPQITDNSFDLLVANPPYSVKGFLETLQPEEERSHYSLSRTVDKLDTSNSIECFFIERAKQLLKAGGIAAIILPASILSNGSSTYIKTREILIQYFDIVAIAEFGSGTFGKTGTNTVTLFLRRKGTAPDTAEHYRERVAEWFKGCDNNKRKQVIYKDADLIDRYAAHIGIPAADYKTLLQGDPHGPWCQTDYFDAYTTAFNDSAEIKNLYKQKKFTSQSEAEQNAEIDRRYLAYVHGIERDKLLHFVLAADQPNPVLIIKSPGDTKAQKQFLGYDWSAAKGDEGIKLVKDANGRHLTVLYDESQRDNPDKLNALIAANFDGQLQNLPENLKPFANIVQLVDMLDFSRVVFEKTISLKTRQQAWRSKWPLKDVASLLCEICGPKTKIEESEIKPTGNIPVITQSSANLIAGYAETKEPISDLPLIVFGDHTCTLKYLDFPFIRGADGTQLLKCRNDLDPKYFYYILSSIKIHNAEKYERHFKYLKTEKIPAPPLAVQQQIVTECQTVDNEVRAAQAAINAAHALINDKIAQISASTVKLTTVTKLNPSKSEIRSMSDDIIVSFVEMSSVSERGTITHSEPKTLGCLRKGSYTYFAENDIIIAKISPCMENGKCALATGLHNGVGMGSTEFHVIRANPTQVIPAYLFALLNRETLRQKAAQVMTGASGHRRVPASFYEELEIPLPSPTEQQRIADAIAIEQRAITAAEALIAAAPARKQAILERYL